MWKVTSVFERALPTSAASLRTFAASLRGIWEDRAAFLSLCLVLLIFCIDLALPLGVASAVPYSFTVLLALKSRSRRFALVIAFLCCALTIIKLPLFPDRGGTELWKVLVNRGLAVFAISLTTFLGMKRRRAEDKRLHAEEQMRLHLADLAHLGRLKTAGQLAASLAHELNQPLAAVSLQAEIAGRLSDAEGAPNQAALAAALREITEQSQRAAGIVRTLRSQVQKSDPVRRPVDLNETVSDVVRLMASQAERAGVSFTLRLAADLPLVQGDKIQLEQVLVNLLQNAIEAVAANNSGQRLVVVETKSESENAVRVAVRDTGLGLTPENVERIFDRFYSTKPQGMGLGLAISRSIVEAHDGRLWAAASTEHDTTFHVELPVLRSARA